MFQNVNAWALAIENKYICKTCLENIQEVDKLRVSYLENSPSALTDINIQEEIDSEIYVCLCSLCRKIIEWNSDTGLFDFLKKTNLFDIMGYLFTKLVSCH